MNSDPMTETSKTTETSKNFEVRLLLYGAFRAFGDGRELKFQIPAGTSLSGIRATLTQRLKELDPSFANLQLVGDSAFADEEEILGADFTVNRACTLAILPPVCGG